PHGGPVTDGLIMRSDTAWGWTAFADNWPDRGRHWIPSVDHPSDKATVSWTVRAPSRLKDHRERRPSRGSFGQRFQPAEDHHPLARSEEHTSELQSRVDIVCRLLLEQKKCKS